MNLVAPGIALVESLMVDVGTLTRDDQEITDDILDEDTLELIPPANDSRLLYHGKCIMSPVTRKELNFDRGGEPVFRKLYRVLLPLWVSDIRLGDIWTLESSGDTSSLDQYDQHLIGIPMRVQMIEGGTYRSARRLHVEYMESDPGNSRE